MRNADRCAVACEYLAELELFTCMLATRTEQGRMADGSVVTTIQGRDPARQQFDLRMRQGSILVIKIANLVILQIQLDIQIEKIQHLLRRQTERSVNILVAMDRVRVRVASGEILGSNGHHPGEITFGTGRPMARRLTGLRQRQWPQRPAE
jgi:hypothetical protein